jgi:SH3-like domain-containing protein
LIRPICFSIALVTILLLDTGRVATPVQAAEGSGLPLPRFVSMRADEANLRAGPGVQYPVEWVYHRAEMPVEIIAEYTTWRKVRDWQGAQGWIHQSILSSARTFIVTGGLRTIRKEPDTKSLAVARVEANVIGKLRACPAELGWCQVEVEGHRGWLRKVDFWGVYPNEALK